MTLPVFDPTAPTRAVTVDMSRRGSAPAAKIVEPDHLADMVGTHGKGHAPRQHGELGLGAEVPQQPLAAEAAEDGIAS
jgi:hypothetical protein